MTKVNFFTASSRQVRMLHDIWPESRLTLSSLLFSTSVCCRNTQRRVVADSIIVNHEFDLLYNDVISPGAWKFSLPAEGKTCQLEFGCFPSLLLSVFIHYIYIYTYVCVYATIVSLCLPCSCWLANKTLVVRQPLKRASYISLNSSLVIG